MAYVYEVDIPAVVRVCSREGCGKRFIETVKNRETCSPSCRTMKWQAKNPEKARRAARDYQTRERGKLEEIKRSINSGAADAD